MKFRIKFENGRIVGPFDASQISELIERKKILGKELCQQFPAGEWLPLRAFQKHFDNSTTSNDSEGEGKTIVNLMLKNVLSKKTDKTKTTTKSDITESLKSNADSENKIEDKSAFKEFDYRPINPEEELEKKDVAPKPKKKAETKPATATQPQPAKEVEEKEIEAEEIKPMPSVEKTVIVNRPHKPNQNITKTKLVNPLPPNKEPTQITQKPDTTAEEGKSEEVETEVENIPAVTFEEKTMVLDRKAELSQIKQSADIGEREIIRQEKEDERAALLAEVEKERKEAFEIEEFNKEEEGTDENEETEGSGKKRKKLTPLMTIVFILLIGYLYLDDSGDEKNQELPPIRPQIAFPSPSEVIEEEKSKEAYEQGMIAMSKDTYLSMLEASKLFAISLKYKFKDNPAIGNLIYSYSQVVDESTDMQESGRIIFQLTKITAGKVLKDINIAIGTSLFYYKMGKFQAAQRTIENYLRIEGNKPSKELFGIYLACLIKTGDLTQAKAVHEKLSAIDRLPEMAKIAIIDFYLLNEMQEEAYLKVEGWLKENPNSVALLIIYADLLFQKQEKKKIVAVLKLVQQLNAGRRPSHFAKYLEFMGMLSAVENAPETATKFFLLATKINDSYELRSKLASLRSGGSNSAQSLILESKIVHAMRRAKIEAEKGNYPTALVSAIKAADLSQSYLPSHLLLINLQIKMGYYESAVRALTKLQEEFPDNNEVVYLLVKTYLASFKLGDARREVQQLARTPFAQSARYSAALADFYFKNNNINFALKYYQEAITRDPLNDEYYFQLAKLLITLRKYKEGQKFLGDAIALDPTRIEFRSLYGKVIYEMQSADYAIGYLRELLKQYPDNPKLLADIAIYYFKSGKVKDFKDTKEIIEKQPIRDANFYKFLIEASKDDNKIEDVVLYTKELLKLEPGNLETRMELAIYLYDAERTQDAKIEFETIKQKLPQYPRVHFYLATIYMGLNDLDKGMENAQEEIKYNPELDLGYYAAGEIHFRKKEYPEAIQFLEKAITKNSSSLNALKALAKIKADQGYHAEAREMLLRALKDHQSDPGAHRDLGMVYKNMGQSALAVEEFEVYLQLAPEAPDKAQITSEIATLK